MEQYVTNEALLAAFDESKTLGKVSDTLADLFVKMVNFFLDQLAFAAENENAKIDLKFHAIEMLHKYWMNFNPEKGQPYTYYKNVMKHAVLGKLNSAQYAEWSAPVKQQFEDLDSPVEPMTRPTETKPIATLLGAVSYTSIADYEKFLNNLTLEHATVVLISAAAYAQSKGAFNLDEAELVAKAVKRFKKVPAIMQTQQPEKPIEPVTTEQPS